MNSIKESLLIEALELAKQRVIINTKNRETIFKAKKTFLYGEEEPWIKKQSNKFDVTVESYVWAEVYELTGTGNKYSPNSIGINRDDELAVFKNTNGLQSEKIKKIFQKYLRTKVQTLS